MGGGGCFFLQPATAVSATTRATGITTRFRKFNAILLTFLLKFKKMIPQSPQQF
jgi:hypothetical protein